jgi:GNAT superfamily N-acetyltransferase
LKENPKTNEVSFVTSKKERKEFIKFLYSHYKNDEYWVAPLLMEQKKLINTEKNPFYNNADIGMFIVRQNGKMCGRIAAIEDRRFNEYHNNKTGFFGFFECIDNQTVASLLIKTASGWLKDRGLTEVLGPTNPSMMDEIGVLVDGFEEYPSVLMPYHKQYYDRLLKAEGLEKEIDLYAFRVSQDTVAIDRMRRAGKIVKKRLPALEIREVNLKKIDEEVQIVREIFNKAWSDNWGFIPLTESELSVLADDLKLIVNTKFAHIVEIEGRPVAFSIGFPDLNQALRHMNGRLFPTGIFKLLWYKRKINRIRTALMGVIPEYRGKGIDALLHLKAIENGRTEGFHSSELSWVLESNEGMIRVAEKIGAHIEKTYRMYRMEF